MFYCCMSDQLLDVHNNKNISDVVLLVLVRFCNRLFEVDRSIDCTSNAACILHTIWRKRPLKRHNPKKKDRDAIQSLFQSPPLLGAQLVIIAMNFLISNSWLCIDRTVFSFGIHIRVPRIAFKDIHIHQLSLAIYERFLRRVRRRYFEYLRTTKIVLLRRKPHLRCILV